MRHKFTLSLLSCSLVAALAGAGIAQVTTSTTAQYPPDYFQTDFNVIDSFDLDPYAENRLEDQFYLEHYTDDLAAEYDVICGGDDDDDDETFCSDGPIVMKEKPAFVGIKDYCRMRPDITRMILELEKSKTNDWYDAAKGVAWVAEKIAAVFGIDASQALSIAEYLVNMKDAIKSIDDLIKALKQWQSAMGKDVCNPLHPDNKEDPDKGPRTVGAWAACNMLLMSPKQDRSPTWCNGGNVDDPKVLMADCDSSCREQGAINSANNITLKACTSICFRTMKSMCKNPFGGGDKLTWPQRWEKARKFCNGLGPNAG